RSASAVVKMFLHNPVAVQVALAKSIANFKDLDFARSVAQELARSTLKYGSDRSLADAAWVIGSLPAGTITRPVVQRLAHVLRSSDAAARAAIETVLVHAGSVSATSVAEELTPTIERGEPPERASALRVLSRLRLSIRSENLMNTLLCLTKHADRATAV